MHKEFSKLELIADLIYFDGPLLSLMSDGYLFLWNTVTDEYNRWLLFKPFGNHLLRYLKGFLPLLSIIPIDGLHFIYIDDKGDIIKVESVNYHDLGKEDLPDKDSFYDKSLASWENKYFEDFVGSLPLKRNDGEMYIEKANLTLIKSHYQSENPLGNSMINEDVRYSVVNSYLNYLNPTSLKKTISWNIPQLIDKPLPFTSNILISHKGYIIAYDIYNKVINNQYKCYYFIQTMDNYLSPIEFDLFLRLCGV